MLKCLLLKTKDNRKFLTSEDNLLYILEFVKTFNAEIYLAEIQDNERSEILGTLKLATAICDSTYTLVVEPTIVKRLYPEQKSGRKDAIKLAKQITDHIHQQLTTGKEVSLRSLKKKYQEHHLTDACLCAHLSRIRRSLEKEGLPVNKVGPGRYQVERHAKV